MLSRLPRASSQACEQLQSVQADQSNDSSVPLEQPQQNVAQEQAPGAQQELLNVLATLKAGDAGFLLEGPVAAGSSGGTLSQITAAAQAGHLPAADTVQHLRALCERVIRAGWAANKEAAQAGSDFLDYVNASMEDFDASPAVMGVPVASPLPQQALPKAALKLPRDTFLLSIDQVRECLTLNIDSSILLRSQQGAGHQQSSRRGGWPLGKKRKVNGVGFVAHVQRKGGKHYNPWTPELQQQLATVLRSTLGGPATVTDEAPPLPQALANLADHLRTLQTGEHLQAMGATLSNSISMLQVGGFTDFEELLSDARDECHAAVDAYLMLQSVDVRRGRLLAHVESFVRMLGTAIESLLSQMRADRAAAVEAGLQDEDDDELDDEFYPSSLPPSILANKEPFKGGDWRKTPYIPRPYVRLTEYDIVEPSMRDGILRKLSTKKHGGCSGNHCKSRLELGLYNVEREGFDTKCSCLARNTECDARCVCHGDDTCLNRAVSNRRILRLGEDADEVDSWGMDCYVRRNVMDAVLESGAFGPWTPPDFEALAAANPVEYAAMRAATNASGGIVASPAAAALALPSKDQIPAGQVARGVLAVEQALPQTPTAQMRCSVGRVGGDEEQEASVAAALATPRSSPAQVAAERRAADWLERILLPAVNRQASKVLCPDLLQWMQRIKLRASCAVLQGAHGWNLSTAVQEVKQRSQDNSDDASLRAAEAVEQRIKEVGYNYFRMHPKGVGLICKRQGGIPPLTFVEEYLGEIHTPWRWFEIQDAVKKITGDELPDFYNIVLERPKDDPDGYDVLFIDAATKVMQYPGEELSFDYSSVTESEKEFRDAICLCSSRNCRGSYMYFTGSRAFQQVMNTKHTFLHRQAIIARAGCEPLTEDDWSRIKRHGLGDSALGSVEHGDRAPDWLIKWTSLICGYIEEEEAHLKEDLLAHPLGIYNEASATIEAKGVVINRLQNVVITLDKVKMVLAHNQPRDPCLKTLTNAEAVEHLWSGPKAVARRILSGCIQTLCAANISRNFVSLQTDQELQAAAEHAYLLPEVLLRMYELVLQPASSFEEARTKLMLVYEQLRVLDLSWDGALTAVADLVLLYASTLHWFTCERGYKSFTSPPVPLNLADLSLDRTQTQTPAAVADSQRQSGPNGSAEPGQGASSKSLSVSERACATSNEAQALSSGSHLRKVYRPLYLWGQLSGWFKQTVNDPTASLSAERRGTVSLPDIESSFGGGNARYTVKAIVIWLLQDRNDLIDQLENRPDAMWRTGTLWSFRNDAKVYGSPMLDAVWCDLSRSGSNPLPAVVEELRTAVIPQRMHSAVAARGKKKGDA
ncbi:Histone-lysine N-methyltransferase [Chlorella vulgaris]